MFSLNSFRLATLAGICALFCWAFGVIFVVYLKHLPLHQLVLGTFSVSFLLTCTKLTLTKKWHEARQPLSSLVIGTVLIYGNQFCYTSAFRLAPAVHADLINYTWPLLLFLMTHFFFPSEKLEARHFVGAVIGFLGVYTLLSWDQSKTDMGDLLGYVLAFGAAIFWCVFCLFMRYFKNSSESVGIYQGLGLPFLAFSNLMKEGTIFPSPSLFEMGCIFCLGLSCAFLAQNLWSYGIAKGNFKLLNILSNFTPALSVCFLLAFGFGSPSVGIFVSFSLVFLGSVIGSEKGWELLFEQGVLSLAPSRN